MQMLSKISEGIWIMLELFRVVMCKKKINLSEIAVYCR